MPATQSPTASGFTRRKHFTKGLYSQFILVLLPVFLLLAIPSLSFLFQLRSQHHEEAFTTRIGNKAARVAAALERHRTLDNLALAHDLLAPLAGDPAILCAEYRFRDGGNALVSVPPMIGCLGQVDGQILKLAAGTAGEYLVIRFSDSEVIESQKFQQRLSLLTITTAFVIALLVASMGFRIVVAQPLQQLLFAVRRFAETGDQRPVAVKSRNELGEIAASFNSMMARVVGRECELRESNIALHKAKEDYHRLNLELEARIAERTQELKHRELALIESEQRLSDFARASSDWYWEMDAELRFSYFSDRFEEVTSVSPKMLLGKTREETGIPNVDKTEWQRHLYALHNHYPFRRFVHPRTKADGSTAWLAINGVPSYHPNGKFRGFRGTGNDITELVAAREKAERAREEAEKANRSKSAFLASMSHDLRTPLNAIIGFSETILAEIYGPLGSEKHREHLRAIHQSGNHLLDLVNDILELSKIESEKYEFTLAHIDLNGLIADCVSIVRAIADRKRLIIVEPNPKASLEIIFDERALRQILFNLLSNAIKFTPGGGRISISASTASDDLTISVEDNGIGIPAEDIPHLLEPFNQGSRRNAYTADEGTGLGLSIVASLVRLHEGQLDIASEPGKGTRVSVYLPGAAKVDKHRIDSMMQK